MELRQTARGVTGVIALSLTMRNSLSAYDTDSNTRGGIYARAIKAGVCIAPRILAGKSVIDLDQHFVLSLLDNVLGPIILEPRMPNSEQGARHDSKIFT
jgi:hypothetical protein